MLASFSYLFLGKNGLKGIIMKKTFLYAAGSFLGFVALNAFSGTACCPQPACCPPPSCICPRPVCGFYVDGDVGVANQDWKSSGWIQDWNNGVSSFTHSITNNPNGFTGGFDAGYKLNCNIAGEIGAYFFPTVNANWNYVNSDLATIQSGTSTISSWFTYAALKLMVPVFSNNLDAFLKIGGAERFAEFRNDNFLGGAGFRNEDINSFNWLFGAGLQYYCSRLLSFNAQWLHLTSTSDSIRATTNGGGSTISSVSVPPADLFLVGIGINLNYLV